MTSNIIDKDSKSLINRDKVSRKKRAKNKFTEFFSRKREAKTPQPENVSPVGLRDPKILEKLKIIYNHRGSKFTESIHVIKISDVKSHFGDKWPKVSEKVHAVLTTAIKRHVSDRDVYTRTSDTEFLILFFSLKKEMGQLRCALIAREAATKIFGDGNAVDRIGVRSISSKGDRPSSVEDVPIAEILSQAISEEDKFASVHQIPVGPANEENENAAVVSPPDALQEILSVDSDENRQESPLSFSELPKTSIDTDFDDLHFIYRPIWSIEKKIVSDYLCLPARIGLNGHLDLGGNALLSRDQSIERSQFDSLPLRRIGDDLKAMVNKSMDARMKIPLHLSTLVRSKERAIFLESIQEIPQNYWQNIDFEVIGISDDTPQFQLAEAISCLTPFCHNIHVRMRIENTNFDKFQGLNVQAFGVDFNTIELTESELRKRIFVFTKSAARNNIKLFAHGANSVSLVSSLVASGFSYTDGDPIIGAVEVPDGQFPYTIQDLYKPLLTSSD
ncbi:MAG: hypothetical protein HQ503_07260 [Rhodospirillales bacterium]|nr:hypothetical protein [Rhodospirillales bacterium]